MPTGTEGNDTLTNDPAVLNEVIDALGGDDLITVVEPNSTPPSGPGGTVDVDGGAGTDTLIVTANRVQFGGGSGFSGSITIRKGSSVPAAFVSWEAIERFELTSNIFGDSQWTFGDSIDILRLGGTGSTDSPTGYALLATGVGNDEVYLRGIFARIVVETGVGDDLIDLSEVTYVTPANLRVARGEDGNDRIIGSVIGETLEGGAGNDRIFAQIGGDDWIRGGDGDDGIYFGAAFTAIDVVEGGAGSDSLALRGVYGTAQTPFQLGDRQLNGIETLLLASAQNVSFQDTMALTAASYTLALADTAIAAGGTLTVIAGSPGAGIAGLQANEALNFDGSAETDGALRIFAGLGQDSLRGGQQNDGFFFTTGGLKAGDVVQGGGGIDSIALRGDYDGAADDGFDGALNLATAGIDDFEVLVLLSGRTREFGGTLVPEGFDYDIVSAAINNSRGLLDVQAGLLTAGETVRFDGRAETGTDSFRVFTGAGDDTIWTGNGGDIIYAALGADTIDGGQGTDTYIYRSFAESTAQSRDTLTLSAGDRIDLAAIDAIEGTAQNDAFTFVGTAAFSGVAGQLRSVASGGGFLIEGDVNGDGVADLTIFATAPAAIAGTDFIL